jgi:hypothetical protein
MHSNDFPYISASFMFIYNNFFLHFSNVYIQGFSISGIVTRCSDVKPLMQFTVYTFERCGFKIYQLNSFHRCTRS